MSATTSLRRIRIPVTAKLVNGSDREKTQQAGIVEARLKGLEEEIDSLGSSVETVTLPLSNRTPEPVGDPGQPGSGTKASRDDHVHLGVASLAVDGEEPQSGDFTFFVEGAVVVEIMDGAIWVRGPQFFDDEVLTPDGLTQTFVLSAAPDPPESLRLNVNGVEYVQDGVGIDGYTLAGDTITTVDTFPAAWNVRASWRIDP